MQSTGAHIELKSVRRSFIESGPVISPLNLEIQAGEFVSLLGPSGCGKSTLLRLIAGLDQSDSGSIVINSHGREFYRAFVFQEAALLPWRDVLRNVMLPLELMGLSRKESEAKAQVAIAKVGLSDSISKTPSQLSGGMKMRASVARALVVNPSLLLLDEPFAALDENTRYRLQEELRALWETLGMTTVFVTHSVSEAVFLSNRAIVFSKRPASVIQDHKINLPSARDAKLRLTPEFAGEVSSISQASLNQEALV